MAQVDSKTTPDLFFPACRDPWAVDVADCFHELERASAYIADVLDDIALGRTPDKTALLVAALSLDTLTVEGAADRELLDAAAALKALAAGRTLELNDAGRARAAQIGSHIRSLFCRQTSTAGRQ